MHRGRLVIAGILTIGIVAACIAVWVNYRYGRRALQYWGPENALLIRDAESVLLVRLVPQEGSSVERVWQVAGRMWAGERQVQVSGRIGTLRVREALLDDAAYDWEAAPGDCQATVLHALVFEGDNRSVTAVLDTKCQLLLREADDRRAAVSISPTNEFFSRWIDQQLPHE
jgi:hypothetical protein